MCVCHPPPRERKRECMHGREHVCVSVCVHTHIDTHITHTHTPVREKGERGVENPI